MNSKIKHVDYYVIETLNNLDKRSYPKIQIKNSVKNVFLGSGNAFNIGLLFAKRFGGQAVSVVNYKEFFENTNEYSSVNIISASGGKDGVKMAEFLKSKNIGFNLITANKDAPAKEFAENSYAFESFTEPPTYNVSTYASMIYWLFKENTTEIKKLIDKIEVPNLRKYKFVFFLSDDKHEVIANMASRKISETLEGIGSHGEGISNGVHGFLTQPNKERLVFCMNQWYDVPGENVYEIKIDSYLGLMLATYYIIGKNQTDRDSENIIKRYEENAKREGWKFNKVL